MIDIDMLKLQAVKTGLGIKYLSKEESLSNLLKQLNEIFPEKTIVLKGGTALNRGYLYQEKKGRFSEDIDLDYIKKISLNEKIKNIKKNMKKIVDFKIDKPRMLHRTIRFDCIYTNQIEEKDRVQVEFYLSNKNKIGNFKKILLQSQYLPTQATNFNVYIFEELLSQKLIALYRRTEGKDIYDLYYGLDLEFRKKEIYNSLISLFNHYHIDLNQIDFFKKLEKKISDMESNSKYIGDSTNHFIPKNLRPNWKMFIADLKEKIDQIFL